jgi:hypothetical protein
MSATRSVAAGSPQILQPPVPRLDHLARFTVELTEEPWQLGRTSDLGDRRIIPITGGRFNGPLLNGDILSNGADWQVVTGDGATIVDTRYLLRMDDGSLVYLRIQLHFETASATYDWLNRVIAVGSAIRLPKAVVYDAYAIR